MHANECLLTTILSLSHLPLERGDACACACGFRVCKAYFVSLCESRCVCVVCVYVCVLVCTRVCMCIRPCVCVYTCMHVSVGMHVGVYVLCMHVSINVCTFIHVYM